MHIRRGNKPRRAERQASAKVRLEMKRTLEAQLAHLDAAGLVAKKERAKLAHHIASRKPPEAKQAGCGEANAPRKGLGTSPAQKRS